MTRCRLIVPIVLALFAGATVSQEPRDVEFLQDTAKRAMLMWFRMFDPDNPFPVPPDVLGQDRISPTFIMVHGPSGHVRFLEPPEREEMPPETGPLPPETMEIYEGLESEVIVAERMAFASCQFGTPEGAMIGLCVFARPHERWELVTLSVGPLQGEPEPE